MSTSGILSVLTVVQRNLELDNTNNLLTFQRVKITFKEVVNKGCVCVFVGGGLPRYQSLCAVRCAGSLVSH